MTVLYILLFVIAALCSLFLLRPLYRSSDLNPTHRRTLIALLLLLFIPGSLAFYSVVGSPRIIEVLDERTVTIAQAEQKAAILAVQTSTQPDQPELWAQLGLALLEAERYGDAVEALRKAVIRSKGDASIIMLYAKAQITASGGKVTDDAKEALDMVLLQDASNLEARYLIALYHVDKHENESARMMLDGLLADLPENIPFAQKVRALREKVR